MIARFPSRDRTRVRAFIEVASEHCRRRRRGCRSTATSPGTGSPPRWRVAPALLAGAVELVGQPQVERPPPARRCSRSRRARSRHRTWRCPDPAAAQVGERGGDQRRRSRPARPAGRRWTPRRTEPMNRGAAPFASAVPTVTRSDVCARRCAGREAERRPVGAVRRRALLVGRHERARAAAMRTAAVGSRSRPRRCPAPRGSGRPRSRPRSTPRRPTPCCENMRVWSAKYGEFGFVDWE